MEKSASSDSEEPRPSSSEYHETATETRIMADESSCAVIYTKYY